MPSRFSSTLPVVRLNPRLAEEYGKAAPKTLEEQLQDAIIQREKWAKRAAKGYVGALVYGGRKACAAKYAYWSQRVRDLQEQIKEAGGSVEALPMPTADDAELMALAAESEGTNPYLLAGISAAVLLTAGFGVWVWRKRQSA